MSEQQLKAFWEAVQADTSLQEKLRATTDADSIASIAKEAGFEITAEEVEEAQSELSEEELKGVAGGLNQGALRVLVNNENLPYWDNNNLPRPEAARPTINKPSLNTQSP